MFVFPLAQRSPTFPTHQGSPSRTHLFRDASNDSNDVFQDSTDDDSLPAKTVAETSEVTGWIDSTDHLKDNPAAAAASDRPKTKPSLESIRAKRAPLERRSTINDLFEALEAEDIKRLKSIADGIRSFNR